MESHSQSVLKREDEPKKEKTKESKTVSIRNEKEKKDDRSVPKLRR